MKLGDALYVYGIVISEKPDFTYKGIENNSVFIVSEGKLNALVHRCKAKAYISNDLEKVKEWVVTHNNVLEKAKECFDGIIPFSFDTIVKKSNEKSSEENLKNWLNKNRKNLEELWDRIRGKDEYAIKFYYDRKKLIQEAKTKTDFSKNKSSGINYLLKGKQEYEIKDKVIKKIRERKQELYDAIKTKVDDIKITQPKLKFVDEKNILLSLSILVDTQQFNQIKTWLQEKIGEKDYQYAGPYPPYSFVERLENG